MTLVLITPPAVEPVSLVEAKAHLRLTGTDDDDYLAALIAAARIQVEAATRRVLIEQTWRAYRDEWPSDGRVTLPLMPVRSIAEITLYDADGTPTVLAADRWSLDTASSPARLFLRGAAPASRRVFNGLEIDVVAGYGPSGLDVPQPLRLAVMMLVARWYENREGVAYGVVPSSIADPFEALVAPFRVTRLA